MPVVAWIVVTLTVTATYAGQNDTDKNRIRNNEPNPVLHVYNNIYYSNK